MPGRCDDGVGRRARRILFCLLLPLALLPPAAAAINGNLQVTVRDDGGELVPGATVTIRGPSLIGERSSITGPRGSARFNAVPAGVYKVEASFPGYSTVIQSDHPVRLDQTTYATVYLVEQSVQRVNVTYEAPLVDVTSTSIGRSLSRDFVDAVPTFREYQSQLFLLPGVQPGSNPSVHGGTPTDNLHLIDGINTNDPVTGTFSTNVNYEVIDHHEIITGGHRAEYGGVVGLTSNLVTKSGGNEWTAGVNFNIGEKAWNADARNDALPSARFGFWDSSYILGGPIVKDRVWHFTSFHKVRSNTETLVPGSSEGRPDRIFDGTRVFAKLTWMPHSNHRLQGQLMKNDEEIPNINAGNIFIGPDQFSKQEQPVRSSTLRYTGVLGRALVLETYVNLHRQDLDFVPQFPDLGPNYSGLGFSFLQFGRAGRETFNDRDRYEIRADLSWFAPRGIGEHNFKFGVGYMKTDFEFVSIPSGGLSFLDIQFPSSLWDLTIGLFNNPFLTFAVMDGFDANNPEIECMLGGVRCSMQPAPPFLFADPADWELVVDGMSYNPQTDLLFDVPSSNPQAAAIGWRSFERITATPFALEPVGQELLMAYAQDDWRIGRATLMLGLRLEQQELRDSAGRKFYDFDTTISPRLGLAYDLKGDGRQKLFFHFGRLYDPLRDNTAQYTGQLGGPLNEEQMWIAPLADYFTWSASGGPGEPGATLSPLTDTPYTDEYLLGYQRQFRRDMSVEVVLIDRETKEITEDFDPILGLGDPNLYPELQDGPTLESLGFADENGDGVVDTTDVGTRFVVYNPPGGFRRFTGVDVTVEKLFRDDWQMLFSYSHSDFEGSVTNDGLFGIVGNDPYWDPRLPHNRGPLPISDEIFKFSGSYRLPYGLEIGAFSSYFPASSRYGMIVRTPNFGSGFWNGEPSLIVNTLNIDRIEFSDALGIPLLLPDGSLNPALDQAIVRQLPFTLKPGRGAYEGPSRFQVDMRLRYLFELKRKVNGVVFLDVNNLFDRQHTTAVFSTLATDLDANGLPFQVTPDNIGDREIYAFQAPAATQLPRRFFVGVRFTY